MPDAAYHLCVAPHGAMKGVKEKLVKQGVVISFGWQGACKLGCSRNARGTQEIVRSICNLRPSRLKASWWSTINRVQLSSTIWLSAPCLHRMKSPFSSVCMVCPQLVTCTIYCRHLLEDFSALILSSSPCWYTFTPCTCKQSTCMEVDSTNQTFTLWLPLGVTFFPHVLQSHAGKVVERHWYEKNKHIFPASRWEIYDPTRQWEKYTVHGGEIRGVK